MSHCFSSRLVTFLLKKSTLIIRNQKCIWKQPYSRLKTPLRGLQLFFKTGVGHGGQRLYHSGCSPPGHPLVAPLNTLYWPVFVNDRWIWRCKVYKLRGQKTHDIKDVAEIQTAGFIQSITDLLCVVSTVSILNLTGMSEENRPCTVIFLHYRKYQT